MIEKIVVVLCYSEYEALDISLGQIPSLLQI